MFDQIPQGGKLTDLEKRWLYQNKPDNQTHPGASQANIVHTTKQSRVGLVGAG
jgi:hypothetical protein